MYIFIHMYIVISTNTCNLRRSKSQRLAISIDNESDRKITSGVATERPICNTASSSACLRYFIRQQTNEDLLHYLLASSDPYITSLRKTLRKTERQFHTDAFELLTDSKKEKDKKPESDNESL